MRNMVKAKSSDGFVQPCFTQRHNLSSPTFVCKCGVRFIALLSEITFAHEEEFGKPTIAKNYNKTFKLPTEAKLQMLGGCNVYH